MFTIYEKDQGIEIECPNCQATERAGDDSHLSGFEKGRQFTEDAQMGYKCIRCSYTGRASWIDDLS